MIVWSVASLPPSPSVAPVDRASLARPTLTTRKDQDCRHGGQVAKPILW